MTLAGRTLAISAALSGLLALWLTDLWRRAPGAEALEIFGRLFVYGDMPAAWLFLPILALASWPPLQRAALGLARELGARPVSLAISSFALFALGARFIYQAHPLSLDEYAAVFQSELFAAGRLTAHTAPDLLDFLVPRDQQEFFFSASRRSGEIASGYWPGFALLLTPFTRLGAPWLLNPAIGAATIWLVQRTALALFGSRELAGLCALITLGSAAVAINAISFYAMPAHLLLNLAFAALLAEPSWRRALAAGLCGSLALTLHNPLPHILFAAPWAIWLALREDRTRTLPALAAGYLPLTLLLGAGWSALLADFAGGSAGTAARATELGAVFAWPNAAIVTVRAIGLAKLWLWAAPAAPVLALFGLHAAKRDARLLLWAASAALTVLGYFFVPFDQGHGWGYRYFHSAWAAIPILAVAAVRAAPDERGRTRVSGFIAASALASLVLLGGLRAHQVHGFIARHLAQLPHAARGTPELVLVNTAAGYYTIDLVQNDALFAQRALVMESLGARANARMRREHFPTLVLLAADQRGEVWGKR